ncbi:hypothetical protein MY5147_005776 [Beauveria neobassiana]
MFTAAAPIAIVIHVLRAILSFFRPPPFPELEDMEKKHNVLLGPVADKFHDEFINQATSEEMFRKYYTVTASNGRTFTYDKDNGDEIRAKFKAIREGLPRHPAGATQTLSVQDYLRDTLTNMSEASIQLYTLHHTTQVAKLLLGELAEDQLSTKLPNSDAEGARDLHTFIAVKFGRVADASKVWQAKKQYPEGHWSLMLTPEDERNARIIVNPDAIITSLTDQERALSARGLAEGSQAIAEQARKLGELVSNHKSLWSSLVEAQKRKDAADAQLLADPKAANATNDKVTKRLLLPRSASACHAHFAAAML